MHEDVLANMEPRMGPNEDLLFGQEEVGCIDSKKTSLRGFCQLSNHSAVRNYFFFSSWVGSSIVPSEFVAAAMRSCFLLSSKASAALPSESKPTIIR